MHESYKKDMNTGEKTNFQSFHRKQMTGESLQSNISCPSKLASLGGSVGVLQSPR